MNHKHVTCLHSAKGGQCKRNKSANVKADYRLYVQHVSGQTTAQCRNVWNPTLSQTQAQQMTAGSETITQQKVPQRLRQRTLFLHRCNAPNLGASNVKKTTLSTASS